MEGHILGRGRIMSAYVQVEQVKAAGGRPWSEVTQSTCIEYLLEHARL